MAEKRILTVQDVSCVGQCSLTVALPILSACGIETCVLPTAVLSTHTAFEGFTFRDLTDDIAPISAHWEKEGIDFDCIYTGYLGSRRQIDLVSSLKKHLKKGGLFIADPAMADNGKLYPGFAAGFPLDMKRLIAMADAVLPNVTEACLLTGTEYCENGDKEYIDGLIEKLKEICGGTIVLKGLTYRSGEIGVAVAKRGEETKYYFHERLPRMSHGTGDIYASVFTGALCRGSDAFAAAKLAADFTVKAIAATEPEHFYGVRFEKALPYLTARFAG